MPGNVRMKWSENGGMAPTGKSIEIGGNELIIKTKTFKVREEVVETYELTSDEMKEVYKHFVDNKFDTIRNDKADGITYDAGSEGIYLRDGKVSKNVSLSPNSPLSGSNLTRYSAVAAAIKRLAGKYAKRSDQK
ncbi:MAG: hypothetical protein KDB79_05655 [Acidobacteria bacterium]|nr:hypothetical protein [Acidobacteriota bacterium]